VVWKQPGGRARLPLADNRARPEDRNATHRELRADLEQDLDSDAEEPAHRQAGYAVRRVGTSGA
jgi:hypothetical protein